MSAEATRTISTEYRHNGRVLTPGVEFSVKGRRGRFRFIHHVKTADGQEWVDGYGGTPNKPRHRSFSPDRIVTVHRVAKTRSAPDA